ncbi:MAG: efflux RND transporter periplasmic adaptor subunit [Cyclobacteriaceae bacterium]|nr:efflux RND transporter periplasmic adaptor subunit [Cyclobacteriaceae bacterium]
MTYTFKAVILLSSVLLASACSDPAKTEQAPSLPPVNVTLATPTISGLQGISASGRVEAGQAAMISTRVMGYIKKINVSVGDPVKKGQLLATIANDDLMAKKAQAQAALGQGQAAFSNAEKDFHRFTELHQKQSASDKELESATFQYASAKAQLESARQMLSEVNAMLTYTNLIAPLSGVVTQKMLDPGSMASPGMPILAIEQTQGLQVRANISESDIDKVKKGTSVNVEIKSIGKRLRGILSEISQSSNSTGGQYQIKIALPDASDTGLYSGMYVKVLIPVNRKTGIADVGSPLVPITSIIHRDQLTGIYTISDHHTALLRWVRLGKLYGNDVEVLSGLDKNEKFVLSAQGKLYNGALVREVTN